MAKSYFINIFITLSIKLAFSTKPFKANNFLSQLKSLAGSIFLEELESKHHLQTSMIVWPEEAGRVYAMEDVAADDDYNGSVLYIKTRHKLLLINTFATY